MISFNAGLFYCLVASIISSTLAALPSYIKVCKRTDPNINDCIVNSIEHLRTKLREGIPELDVPAVEPLILDQIRLLRGPVGARLDVNISGLQVYGPSTFRISDFHADVENVIFKFKVAFNKLQFRGKYSIDTRLLLLRLKGDGPISGNFSKYESDVVLRAKKVFRNDNVYINFDKMEFDIKIGKSYIHLGNLFNGNPVLSATSNELINSNSAIFLDELRPAMETSLANLFTDVANKITRSFTYDELFPKE
ncbi:hypothetical protein QAD02_004928 [Eretmocerus hayati]|uniref:Uncharacterized protein n=1 Tax=Eretmocerus hayati TaxID=131215 RepID=A0ACC2NS12_9HYME|nr:hypothetical protein QAD02_004928 [Eretmocerus hayati]